MSIFSTNQTSLETFSTTHVFTYIVHFTNPKLGRLLLKTGKAHKLVTATTAVSIDINKHSTLIKEIYQIEMTQMFMWPNATTTFPHAQQTPLTGQQGNLLFTKIITWLAHEPGMGLKVPINNPIQTRRRASLSSSKYSIRGRARTQILCSGYNVQLKTRRRNEIRPLNTKRRSTKHCQPLHTEIYTQAGGLEINNTIKRNLCIRITSNL